MFLSHDHRVILQSHFLKQSLVILIFNTFLFLNILLDTLSSYILYYWNMFKFVVLGISFVDAIVSPIKF